MTSSETNTSPPTPCLTFFALSFIKNENFADTPPRTNDDVIMVGPFAKINTRNWNQKRSYLPKLLCSSRTETTTIFWQKFLSYFLAATKEIFAAFNIDFSLNIYDGNSSDQKQSRRRKVIAEFEGNYLACELSKHLIMNNKSSEFPLMNSFEVKG